MCRTELKRNLNNFVTKIWYPLHKHSWGWVTWLLAPIACMYYAFHLIHKTIVVSFIKREFSIPIIVIGNITVGGVGKTPLVITIANKLHSLGLRVRIVSRGYKAQVKHTPFEVTATDNAIKVGDEPLLLATNTNCPIVIAKQRIQAVQYLITKYQCQVIISDDGLQHYAMGRSIEIIVIDGQRSFGNGWILPAGPLRELPKRLVHSDFVIVNGTQPYNYQFKSYAMRIESSNMLINLATKQAISIKSLLTPIAAVAAIGNPQQFFDHLRKLGISIQEYPFPDHHIFSYQDLACLPEQSIIMTAKDAVKCKDFACNNWFYLPIAAHVTDAFWYDLSKHTALQGLLKL